MRLTAKGQHKDDLERDLEIEVNKLKILVEDLIVGSGDEESLEVSINKLLRGYNQTLSLAESCTGGNISKKITAEAGASQFLRGAIVAYNADIKMKILEVPKEMIEKYSVVSSEVAREMASGCQKLFESDYAIATTGNAGPTTDKTDKTVGDVFIAIATPSGIFVHEFSC